MTSNPRQARASDYNRTHDPLLRGWTRKQPKRRRGRAVAAIIVIIAAVLFAVGVTMTTAKGDDGVVCVARAGLTICPPSYEVAPRLWLGWVTR